MSILQKEIHSLSNMSFYYDYYVSLFPNIKESSIKELLLLYLNEYSFNNEIEIDSMHPFSADILNTIKKNIILKINDKKIKTKENKNIKTIVFQKYIGNIIDLVENIIPHNIRNIHFKYHIDNICDVIIKLKYYKQIEQITFIDKIGEMEIELIQQYFPLLNQLKLINNVPSI